MNVGDFMDIFNILITWDWCSNGSGLAKVFHMIKEILNIVRIAVPIGLIVMTSLDVIKKVINPDEKEGQQKIMNRAIAALVVFFIPTFIKFTFKVIDWGQGRDGSYENAESGLSRCWR